MPTLVAPFPYFGGKRRAAPIVWDLLGDVDHYIEPFCGSLAVLLARPHHGRRTETVNDADGWLVNTWRSIQLSPDETAYHAAGPVAEVDYHAMLAWLQERRDDFVPWLEGDPEHHDAKAAGWWLRVQSAGIGDPWGAGPWRVVDGHLRKLDGAPNEVGGVCRALPDLGTRGRGVNRGLPHLGDKGGRGVNRELPAFSTRGQGVNRDMTSRGRKQQGIADELRRLSRRLEFTRIACGDWTRVLTNAALHAGLPTERVGVFLDPPYAVSGDLYATTNHTGGPITISDEVRQWCTTIPTGLRVILCGYEDEHDALLDHGWTKTAGRHTTGGYAKDKTRVGKTENLWLSPSVKQPQASLF